MWINHFHPVPEGIFARDCMGLISSDPKAGTFDALKELMDQLGVEKAVTFAPFEWQEPHDGNAWLYEQIKNDDRFLGFITLNPQLPYAVYRLREYVKKGFVGAKIHPPAWYITVNDKKNYRFYETAQDLGVPVIFHTGVHGWYLKNYRPLLLDDVAQDFPELNIIMAHIGGEAFYHEALAVLMNNPKTFGGLESTRESHRGIWWHISPERVNNILTRLGPERLIYGTDWPWKTIDVIKDDLEYIRSFDISDDEKSLILGGNLKRILRV